MVVTWTIPDPVAGGFWLENPSRAGGMAQNGQEQVISTLSMRQRAHWTVPIRNHFDVQAARAMLAELQGRAEAIDVPCFEPHKGRSAVTVAAAAAARDTTISLNVTGPAPEVGRHFSVNHRAYLIRTVTGTGPYVLTFFPPLRFDAASGDAAAVDFANCRMRLVEDQYPILLDVMRFAMLELEFTEFF